MDSESDLGFVSPGLPASPLQGLALLFVGVDAERVVAGGLQKALGPGPVPDLLGGCLVINVAPGWPQIL